MKALLIYLKAARVDVYQHMWPDSEGGDKPKEKQQQHLDATKVQYLKINISHKTFLEAHVWRDLSV